jgi:pyruvate dehydrogenase E2 component (dihydrolipoamide acetyltransferase)
MSVTVSMPQLGESVTEGTVTRWLKHEGERGEADEPLLEVSTDKVDTEIPSPVSGILRGISVAEDETVAVGAALATIDEDGAAGSAAVAEQAAPAYQAAEQAAEPAYQAAATSQPPARTPEPPAAVYEPPAYNPPPAPAYEPPAAPAYEPPAPAYEARPPAYEPPAPAYEPPAAAYEPAPLPDQPAFEPAGTGQFADGAENPYVTPLVRKLAAEHGIDIATITGTGVGGRIRKQDILDAAQVLRGSAAQQQAAAPPVPAQPERGVMAAPATAAPVVAAAPAVAQPSPLGGGLAETPARQAVVPSRLRGTTERMSRARQVIAQRMVESLQTSAQLTTVVEADVTAIARLRDRAKAAFEAREGVKLSFLPFFALAAVEALKVHPKLNAVIDTANNTVTYHDAEHLGIAVDTDRGLMVPVIRNAGDLNIGGLARKIADLAERTRAGQVSPDDLAGGTFTLTNTGSRGALFDTPIINQPQVGILGTGTVAKRAVVVEDPALGEVITVRSMVYLALTYDHRLVDGADAARFLVTMKARLEEGAFETELGL